MSKAKIMMMTDSGAGLTPKESKRLGVPVVHLPVTMDDETFIENVNLTLPDFLKRLPQAQTFFTSQPSPEQLMKMWERGLEDAEEILYLPMSKHLSGGYQTAKMLADDYDGKVVVADLCRLSIAQKEAILDALAMAKAGMTAAEICEELERTREEYTIYLGVDTLKYLKKGGRITPAAAALGTVLQIKPILTVEPTKVDSFRKVRGMKALKQGLVGALRQAVDEQYQAELQDGRLAFYVAHATTEDGSVKELVSMMEAAFPKQKIQVNPLCMMVSCHTGPGALGVGVAVKHR